MRLSHPHVRGICAVAMGALSALWYPVPGVSAPPAAFRVRPADFEPQQTLVLAARELLSESDVLAAIVGAAHRRVEVVIAVVDNEMAGDVRQVLRDRGLSGDAVSFRIIPHNTMWARDYGPQTVRTPDNRLLALDPDYTAAGRKDDDLFPTNLARHLALPSMLMPVELDGGNLISNGQGMCVTTLVLADDNRQMTRQELTAALREWCGCEQTVFLKPLVREPTGHVDMFATFTSPDTILVGDYCDTDDQENTVILDENAKLLSRTLNVRRIPMPPNTGDVWRTYTNVVYANGAVLVPIYPGWDVSGRLSALQTFRELLPGWRVVRVDAGSLIESGGGLRCITCTIPRPSGGRPRPPIQPGPGGATRSPRTPPGGPPPLSRAVRIVPQATPANRNSDAPGPVHRM